MVALREIPTASLSAVKRGDRDGWLSLFAEDAVVEDPVGKSPLDPTGLGHRGKAAIAAFYDNVIAKNESFDYKINKLVVCGNECANYATFTITFPGGHKNSMDLIIVYRQAADGKIASLRAFWEFEGTMRG